MATLGDIAGEINAMIGNRNDVLTYSTFPSTPNPQDTDRLMLWLKEAYTEICLGYRFEELEVAFTDVMTVGNDVYPLPSLARTLRAVTLLFPVGPGGTIEPRPIRRRHIRNIRRYQTSSQGPPSIYAPYNPGAQPSIIVRPVPDQAYNFIWDYTQKPAFASGPVGETLASTAIQLPDDWIDVLKWSTVLRGRTALNQPNEANAVQTLLFGGYDPGLGRRVPGMIRQRISARDQTDIEDVEFGLQPQVRRYGNSV